MLAKAHSWQRLLGKRAMLPIISLFFHRDVHVRPVIKLIRASNIRRLDHCIQRRHTLHGVLLCSAEDGGWLRKGNHIVVEMRKASRPQELRTQAELRTRKIIILCIGKKRPGKDAL